MKPQKPRRPQRARSRYEVASTFGRLSNRSGASPSGQSPRWMGMLLLLLLGFLALLIMRWFLNEQMVITDVLISESYTVPAGTIKQATSDLRGRNILVLNLEDLLATVKLRNTSTVQLAVQRLREQPGILDAQIFCGTASRQHCEVDIKPNPPIAVFQTGVGTQSAVMYLDDKGGVWTGQYTTAMEKLKTDTALLSVILENDTPLPTAGSTEFRDKPYIMQALRELIVAQPEMRDYFYSNRMGWSFNSPQKTRIVIGFAERSNFVAEKLRLAEQIRVERAGKGIVPKMIDVRFIDAPTYR